ncbi:elongation factor G [Sphingomonas canadensis]|uniref:Elongation factor G n=1 Tax=Sphingomonas canadensis TaxID=1219257 RepID=A0ABW3H8V1_9SPHN|nr:elongation factor G [Sphingomonas canadensis]MCW3837411.1 elongation factor G [Sphingomonas canadensis]
MKGTSHGTRAIALVGPAGAGKTSLAEALLFASGAIARQGQVAAGTSTGDASPEARARGGSTELNLMRLDFMGEDFVIADAPGSPGLAEDAAAAVLAADLALVVIDSDPARAALAEPVLRWLEGHRVPHAVFVNKIDQARGTIEELLEALQPMSAAALVARQIPIRRDGQVTGFVDLALERAFLYQSGRASQQVPIAADLREAETAARFHMLEQLADHDDALLEQLISDETPSLDTVCADITRETGAGLVVPVLFGSAVNGFGVRRLLKMLRHDAPTAEQTARRLGIEGPAAQVVKILHGSGVGRLAIARVFGGALNEGAELTGNAGKARSGALFTLQGAATAKVPRADPGDIVGIAKADSVHPGELLGLAGKPARGGVLIDPPVANCALAIAAQDHRDDVRLATALARLTEEDPALGWRQDEAARETLLLGASEDHLAIALERLRRRYGVAVAVRPPRVAYRESIRRPATQRGRHKKQSGGHGQYGDCVIEIRPLERGEGFRFEDRITGGAIPKQWIPAVEMGVRDAMARGPLGFPVVDVVVTLVDGSFHSVDSSELAFRTAGRMAMAEALAAAAPYLLEPVAQVTIRAPGSATSRITSAVAGRRGQMLGFAAAQGWSRWDEIALLLPEAELHGLEAELRSLSQGMARYEAKFDHLAEVAAKLAQEIARREQAAA